MNFNRDKNIQTINSQDTWDIVIIGGGASGLGAALDAASRGYKTLLLEKHDFAKGTSSRSTKLVHGGVRYLANGDIKLVYSALFERGLIFQNAPHLARVQSFVIPCFSLYSKLKFLIGLKLYDLMAGKYRIGKSVFLSKNEVVDMLPTVRTGDLKGGVQYYDGQFDDARLALNLAQSAAENGATILNYAGVTSLGKDSKGIINAVTFKDEETQQSYTVNAKVVINATGIFVDEILQMESKNHRNLVRPSQGTHIVIDKKFLGKADALMIPETSDGRVLFGVPWHGHVLLGTTDTPLNEHQIEPKPLAEEIDFILQTAKDYMEHYPTKDDILSIYAGLRPLAAPTDKDGTATKEISRDHKLLVSPAKLVTITGGKWTTYRKMAEETVNKAAEVAKLPQVECKTKDMKIHGYTKDIQAGQWQFYGSDAKEIQALAKQNPSLAAKLSTKFDHIEAEVVWATTHEMARKVEDILARRMRILFLDAKEALNMAPRVAALMAQTLGKDDAWVAAEIASFKEIAAGYTI